VFVVDGSFDGELDFLNGRFIECEEGELLWACGLPGGGVGRDYHCFGNPIWDAMGEGSSPEVVTWTNMAPEPFF